MSHSPRITPEQAAAAWGKATDDRLVAKVNRRKLQQIVQLLDSGPLTRGLILPDGTNVAKFLNDALEKP